MTILRRLGFDKVSKHRGLPSPPPLPLDEPGIYTFLQEDLEEEGYHTLVASDGGMALQYFADWHPDLILLDWMLPTMSGIEVCSHIRQSDTQIPIIFLTARDTLDDTLYGLRAGANDYIKKPFAFGELVERIKIHFRNRREDELPVAPAASCCRPVPAAPYSACCCSVSWG